MLFSRSFKPSASSGSQVMLQASASSSSQAPGSSTQVASGSQCAPTHVVWSRASEQKVKTNASSASSRYPAMENVVFDSDSEGPSFSISNGSTSSWQGSKVSSSTAVDKASDDCQNAGAVGQLFPEGMLGRTSQTRQQIVFSDSDQTSGEHALLKEQPNSDSDKSGDLFGDKASSKSETLLNTLVNQVLKETENENFVEEENEESEHVQAVQALYRRVVQGLPTMSEAEALSVIPRDEAGELTSVGSILHEAMTCKVCAFRSSKMGCKKGWLCPFCHFPHNKNRRKKNALRPCKGKRDRYRKLLTRLMEKILDDEDFDLYGVQLPPSLSANQALREGLFNKLLAFQQQVKSESAARRAEEQDPHRGGTNRSCGSSSSTRITL